MIHQFLGFAFMTVHLQFAAATDSLDYVQQNCRGFQAQLSRQMNVVHGTARVPKNWANPTSSESIPIFWWKRVGSDSNYPPLLYVHGGPGSNSWAILDYWPQVYNSYPGDVVAVDLRGEGCSKTESGNLDPQSYSNYGVRSIVRDLEFLRTNVFQYSAWRLAGHSRGASIVQYYLEMSPEGIESAVAAGYSVMSPSRQREYTRIRGEGFHAAATKYEQRYPGDRARLENLRQRLDNSRVCWNLFDGRTLCGGIAVDVLSSLLARYDLWNQLHTMILQMSDLNYAQQVINSMLMQNVIVAQTGYVLGTQGRDFASMSKADILSLKQLGDPIYQDTLLSEIRLMADGIIPISPYDWASDVDNLDYDKVRAGLREHNIDYFLFSSEHDPIAPPTMYADQVQILGSEVVYKNLSNAGHEAFFFSPEVARAILKPTENKCESTLVSGVGSRPLTAL